MTTEALTLPLHDERIAEGSPLFLADLKPGMSAYVAGISTNGLLRRRLLDLGFVPGAGVEAVFESPAGDPIVYLVRGAKIALRKSDAGLVEITTSKPSSKRIATSGQSCATSRGCGSCSLRDASASMVGLTETKEHFIVALAGNPNTGKSTVFNALTGLRQHVGNWPGKTVTRAEGWWSYNGNRLQLVDLPGTYSLLSTSADEEIARDFLLFGAPDCTVVVVDATCLERNLNLVFQILEITDRVVVCVNLMDEATRKGIEIDLGALEEDLGVPVVGTSARSGVGLDTLKEKVLAVARGEIRPSPRRLHYEEDLQDAIDSLLPYVEEAFPGMPNARWIAMRLIDGGDVRLREEIEGGILADLAGQIGDSSLGGVMLPQS